MTTDDASDASHDLPVVDSAAAQTQSNDAAVPDPIPRQDATQLAQPAVSIPIPDEAADSDLIEKEWVERAKQIVEHTGDDPYEQQRAVSQMKADYMKKRYNKDIKLSDS